MSATADTARRRAMPTPVPFRLHVDDEVLADLQARLRRTRWPDEAAEPAPWTAGTSLAYAQGLVEHWLHRFDWRAEEAALNAFPQYRVALDGIDLHYLHVPGQGPAPLPLLLSHGWPGSVLEFVELIPRLTDPARFGGDPRDAFTVVAPSLPGFTLSFRPGQPRLGVEEIAAMYKRLMVEVLGYMRFGTQGGDWGAFVTSRLAWTDPQHVIGLHLNFLALPRDLTEDHCSNDDERRYLGELRQFLREETGYQAIQGTRPQTLAFGLTDSPAGLAAWIAEKFRAWTDCDGDPARAVAVDRMLANITLYWATGAIGSSFWPYYLRAHRPWPVPLDRPVAVPMGYVQFPKEILAPPRSLAARQYADIRRWTQAPRGGHFAALEQPDLLADEVRAFFRPLRGA